MLVEAMRDVSMETRLELSLEDKVTRIRRFRQTTRINSPYINYTRCAEIGLSGVFDFMDHFLIDFRLKNV